MNTRGTTAAAIVAGGLLLAGCASLIPTGAVLSAMSESQVDTVVDKVAERYPQVARVFAMESLVIALDSVIVPHGAGEAWSEDEQRLVTTIAAHMLGEEIGRDWAARVARERAVIGEGEVAILILRDRKPGGPPRYLIDAGGLFDLFLPVAAGGKASAIEVTSFDVKVANQHIVVPFEGGAVEVYGEMIPRGGSYTDGGIVFKRWASALFHLGWGAERAAAGAKGGGKESGAGAGASPGSKERIQPFLENAKPYIGPVVRLKVSFERGPDGMHRFALGAANAIDVVLPNALVAGDRALEGAVGRLAQVHPRHFERKGDDIFVRVGYFFFHTESTGPTTPGPSRRAETAELKKFRIPPGDQPPAKK